jgi:hypothetical protein
MEHEQAEALAAMWRLAILLSIVAAVSIAAVGGIFIYIAVR